MAADPPGGIDGLREETEGRQRALLERLEQAKRTVRRASQRRAAIPAPPPKPRVIRVRTPFWPAAIVILLAIASVPASFALARLTAANDKPATVIDVQYEPTRHEIIIWLADGPMTGLPRRVHRHYELIPHASMRVISYRTSADGQEVFVTLRASPPHRQDAAMVYKTRRR